MEFTVAILSAIASILWNTVTDLDRLAGLVLLVSTLVVVYLIGRAHGQRQSMPQYRFHRWATIADVESVVTELVAKHYPLSTLLRVVQTAGEEAARIQLERAQTVLEEQQRRTTHQQRMVARLKLITWSWRNRQRHSPTARVITVHPQLPSGGQ